MTDLLPFLQEFYRDKLANRGGVPVVRQGKTVLRNGEPLLIAAGGAGERLYPLTRERAKPAVHTIRMRGFEAMAAWSTRASVIWTRCPRANVIRDDAPELHHRFPTSARTYLFC